MVSPVRTPRSETPPLGGFVVDWNPCSWQDSNSLLPAAPLFTRNQNDVYWKKKQQMKTTVRMTFLRWRCPT
ncbi:hypothetical protein MRX96_002381 [Rhipicephalus microplus]